MTIVPTLRRRVFNLAWPVIAENFLETLLGLVDTYMVAHLAIGTLAVAGIGGALQVLYFMISILSALSIGSAVLVAQAVGARNERHASDLARQSLIWSVIVSVPLAIAGWFAAAPIINLFGMEPAAAAIGAEYLRVTMGTIVVLVALYIGGGVLRGAGDSRTPLVVTTIANVINAGLAYVLINGAFGLPALGPVGSAWAAFIARAIALVLLIAVLWRGRNGISIRGSTAWRPDFSVARRVMSIGVPAALEQVITSGAFFVFTAVVGRLGTEALAAHRIAINALSLAFLPGFGFGIAATALVGQSMGARRMDEGSQVARIATGWAVVWMGIIGAIFFFAAEPVMRLFTNDPLVASSGAAGLRVMAIGTPFWAIGFTFAGALRGTGDTRWPMWINSVNIWTSVLLAAFVGLVLHSNLAIVWAAFIATSPVAPLLVIVRFRRVAARLMAEHAHSLAAA
ncbi:MAG: MATE family efflux transporter [Chloroflexi bacterium]|nr:MATE family efflux transporter [Chloroflexota bacterium]